MSSQEVSRPAAPDAAATGGAWVPVALVILSMAIYAAAMGFRNPLLALHLEQRQVSSPDIGVAGLGQAAAFMMVSLLVPAVLARLGLLRTVLAAVALEAAAMTLLAAFDDLLVWTVTRTALGASTAVILACGETWVGTIAPADGRGRVMGIYTTAVGLGLTCGPLIVSAVDPAGAAAFLVEVGLAGLCALLFLCAPAPPPAQEPGVPPKILTLFRTAPLLAVAFVLIGIKDTALTTFLPIFGLHRGLERDDAILLLTLCLAGGIAMPPVIGWMADRVDRMKALLGCTLLFGVTAAALPFAADSAVLRWPTVFLLGGFGSGVFATVMAVIAHRFAGSGLAAAYAGTGIVWGVGSMIGGVAGGAGLEVWNGDGLPLLLSGLFIAFSMAGLAARPWRRAG